MSEIFIYTICIISLTLSTISIYMSLSLAKSVKNVQQSLQILFQVLSQPHEIIYSYDEYGEYGEEINKANFTKDDKVIDMFSRQALEWNEELGIWMPKDPISD